MLVVRTQKGQHHEMEGYRWVKAMEMKQRRLQGGRISPNHGVWKCYKEIYYFVY